MLFGQEPFSSAPISARYFPNVYRKTLAAASTGLMSLVELKRLNRKLTAVSSSVTRVIKTVKLVRKVVSSSALLIKKSLIWKKLTAVSSSSMVVSMKRTLKKALSAVSSSVVKRTYSILRILKASSAEIASRRYVLVRKMKSVPITASKFIRAIYVKRFFSSAGVALVRRTSFLVRKVQSMGQSKAIRSIVKKLSTTSSNAAFMKKLLGRKILAITATHANFMRIIYKVLLKQSASVTTLKRAITRKFKATSTSVSFMIRSLGRKLSAVNVTHSTTVRLVSFMHRVNSSVQVSYKRIVYKVMRSISTEVPKLARNLFRGIKATTSGVSFSLRQIVKHALAHGVVITLRQRRVYKILNVVEAAHAIKYQIVDKVLQGVAVCKARVLRDLFKIHTAVAQSVPVVRYNLALARKVVSTANSNVYKQYQRFLRSSISMLANLLRKININISDQYPLKGQKVTYPLEGQDVEYPNKGKKNTYPLG